MHALGRLRPVILVLLVPVILGVAGCGADKDPMADGPARSTAPAEQDDEIPADVCGLITDARLSEALGATVTTEVGPSGDCEFGEEDPRGLSGSLGIVGSADTNGGFDGYVTGLDATLENATPAAVDGLAGEAVVKVGIPSFGSGENLMAGGVVDHGSYLLQITVVQGKGLPEDTLRTAAENALRYVDQQLS